MKFHPKTVQSLIESPLGPITLAATPFGLTGVWFTGQRHLPPELAGIDIWRHDPSHDVLQEAARQLQQYFVGSRSQFDLPLDLACGTDFQQAVWQALLAIPQGKTLSYGAISAGIGKPTAVRATGAAIGRNPVSIIVPCHRVIGGTGMLTGYAGGLHRKTALLTLEGAIKPASSARLADPSVQESMF